MFNKTSFSSPSPNSTTSNYHIVLTGGGSGGHIWPHFALFEAGNSELVRLFQNHQLKVSYIGSINGMESHIVKSQKKEWRYISIQTGKLRRYFSLENFIDPFKIMIGFFQAFIYLKKENVSLVFSKGGFVSAPVVWAARLLNIPCVIHESDVTPALATKLTLPFATKIILAFPETLSFIPRKYHTNTVALGLPLRESLFSKSKEDAISFFQLDTTKKTILIFGGSLGALSLNEKMYQALPHLTPHFNVIHITGVGRGSDKNFGPNYKKFEFLTADMPYAYAAADVAICRAGASSIFELAAARIPMILFPLGTNASRGDQIVNAKVFSQKNWAEYMLESDFNLDSFLKLFHTTIENLEEKKHALSLAPKATAANEIGNILCQILLPSSPT